MGVSTNSSVFLSDKDPKPMDQEFGLRVRPTREIQREDCKTSIPEEDHKKQFTRLKKLSLQECGDQEEHKVGHQENQRYNIMVPVPMTPPPLMLKKLEIPSYEVISTENDDSSNDGFKTPTSLDHKIPPMLECPGAPRKKITRTPTKRKAACRRRLVFDMSKEVESMFTMSFMEDLPAGASDKNKKLKSCLFEGLTE